MIDIDIGQNIGEDCTAFIKKNDGKMAQHDKVTFSASSKFIPHIIEIKGVGQFLLPENMQHGKTYRLKPIIDMKLTKEIEQRDANYD